MILERMHYIPIGWWRWSKVRLIIFVYRLSGGLRKRIGLNQHFQMINPEHDQVRFKPVLLRSHSVEEMKIAHKICPVDAITFSDKHWKIDTYRCNSCHLCIKVAPNSLTLQSAEGEEIVSYPSI